MKSGSLYAIEKLNYLPTFKNQRPISTREKMTNSAIPITRIIQNNFLTIMNFAFSHGVLDGLLETKFKGEWKILNRVLFTDGEQRASQAFIDLAVYLRLLDDIQGLSKEEKNIYGTLTLHNGNIDDLKIREVSNKIIHSDSREWDFSQKEKPIFRCVSHKTDHQKNTWKSADIDVVALAGFCGRLSCY